MGIKLNQIICTISREIFSWWKY